MKRFVFLDRDGTINVDHGFVHRIEDWEWQPKAIEALQLLQQHGFELAVVTNQSGIGHELYTEEDMHRLHDYMKEELARHTITLAAIAYCPHRRDGNCVCRKPSTGLAQTVEKIAGKIDYPHSWTIGDKIADLEFGQTLGTKTVLLRSTYWSESSLLAKPDIIASSLFEGVQQIIDKA
jgi:D-glycero-D-manno-heptose 1,7-bisphosphate phosphatase